MLFYHNPRVGGSSPSSATKIFKEIDQIYQSHLIYGEFRIRFNMLICQSVCDRCVTEMRGYLVQPKASRHKTRVQNVAIQHD